jgi:hypothetical protein
VRFDLGRRGFSDSEIYGEWSFTFEANLGIGLELLIKAKGLGI